MMPDLIQPTELSGFKRRATAVLKSNLILEFCSASISTTFGIGFRHSLCYLCMASSLRGNVLLSCYFSGSSSDAYHRGCVPHPRV